MRQSVRSLLYGMALSALALVATVQGAQANAPAAPDDAALEGRADSLIETMTPEEKAAQLTTYFYIYLSPEVRNKLDPREAQGLLSVNKPAMTELSTNGLGSLLMLSDAAEANRLQKIALEQSRLKIPILFGYDLIHGLRTIFPVPLAMAASWDPALAEKAQAAAAAEGRAVGIDWAFAPMVDIARDPRWGRVVEGAGEDPYLGAKMAAAQVRGFQGPRLGTPGRILAGPKHFAAYGAALGGRDYDEADVSDAELWNVYLPPFKAAIDAGAMNLMSAYVPVNGVPGAANRWLLTDVLRKTWGFKGFVVSDSAAVNSLVTQNLATDKRDAATRAVGAGLDMEMVAPLQTAAMETLPDALKAGQIEPGQVNEAVRRVLMVKLRLGLFEHPYVDVARVGKVLGDPAHMQLARVAAERSAVLLRNDGALLPLDRAKLHSVAVIGPLADSERDTLGPWIDVRNKPTATTILAGLKAKLGSKVQVTYSPGVKMIERVYPSPFVKLDSMMSGPPAPAAVLDDAAEIKHAVALAQAADVAVMVLGEGQQMIGESASRSDLTLPGRQQELLDAVVATGKPVVVLLMSARPLDLQDTKAQAILDVWYPGSAGGEAAANLLFGDAVPGGKLPFTWINGAAAAPNPYAHYISHAPLGADKRYWNGSSAPTYPFGYGLSYSTFAFANLKVAQPSVAVGQPVTVTVDLKNTGARTADEVAELYIHQRSGTSARPIRQLKGFQRVTLKPGETRTLSFTLTPDDLRYWSAVTRGWVADAAAFDVWIGGSEAATLAGQFTTTKP